MCHRARHSTRRMRRQHRQRTDKQQYDDHNDDDNNHHDVRPHAQRRTGRHPGTRPDR